MDLEAEVLELRRRVEELERDRMVDLRGTYPPRMKTAAEFQRVMAVMEVDHRMEDVKRARAAHLFYTGKEPRAENLE